MVRTYLKNNLSAHGSVAKRFKMYCSSRFQRDSAFSPFHAPDSRDFAKLNLLVLSPNIIFEIGYNKRVIHGRIPPCYAPESDNWEETECDEVIQNIRIDIHVCPISNYSE